jgi:hypothetical protein
MIYNKILTLAENETVKLADSFREKLHTHLVLTQTRHMCRHGTLSEGHEKLTSSQRYFQAIREMYYLSQSICNAKIEAKLSQADYIEAKESLEKADTVSKRLRAEAQIERAESKMMGQLVTVEDLTRMLDEYNKIRLELEPEVMAKYPNGIEQAEQENWEAVARYRVIKGGNERLDNLPISPERKAELAFELGRQDLLAAYFIKNEIKAREMIEAFESRRLSQVTRKGIQ